jgi:hypothetical protein
VPLTINSDSNHVRSFSYIASVGIRSATIDDTHAAEALFDVLSEGKDKLARHKMSLRIKGLAEGEEGLTWAKFHAALVTALAL